MVNSKDKRDVTAILENWENESSLSKPISEATEKYISDKEYNEFIKKFGSGKPEPFLQSSVGKPILNDIAKALGLKIARIEQLSFNQIISDFITPKGNIKVGRLRLLRVASGNQGIGFSADDEAWANGIFSKEYTDFEKVRGVLHSAIKKHAELTDSEWK